MNLLSKSLTCLMLTAFSAAAIEKEIVDQIMLSAKNIEKDASQIGVALKAKKPDADDVRNKIDAMSGDVTKLQELVSGFDATHPQLSERDQADWKLLKEKVQLLEIFHGQKKSLASSDLYKNRSLIRAHANGVAERAQKLQQTALKLQRSPAS